AVIEEADVRPLAQQPLRVRARPANRLVDAELDLLFPVELFEQLDFGEIAPGILNLRPAELDAAARADDERLLQVAGLGGRQVAGHESLRAVEEHAGRLPR